MKYVNVVLFRNVQSVLFSVLSLSLIACNSSSNATSSAATSTTSMISTGGCSVTQSGGSATIHCADGSSATVSNGAAGSNGSNGSAGVQGATGPAGANGSNGSNGTNGTAGSNGTNGTNGAIGPTGLPGMFQVQDRNSAVVGNELISLFRGASAYGNNMAALVHYDTDNVYVYYDSFNGMANEAAPAGVQYIYYSGANCTGTSYVMIDPTGSAGGLMLPIQNLYFRQAVLTTGVTGQIYVTTVSTGNVVSDYAYSSMSEYDPTFSCANTSGSSTPLMEVTAESSYNGNASVVLTAMLPFSLVTQ